MYQKTRRKICKNWQEVPILYVNGLTQRAISTRTAISKSGGFRSISWSGWLLVMQFQGRVATFVLEKARFGVSDNVK